MKFGMTLKEALKYKEEEGKKIERWFAWKPVQLKDESWRWLCFVNRQFIFYYDYIKSMRGCWKYTEYKG